MKYLAMFLLGLGLFMLEARADWKEHTSLKPFRMGPVVFETSQVNLGSLPPNKPHSFVINVSNESDKRYGFDYGKHPNIAITYLSLSVPAKSKSRIQATVFPQKPGDYQSKIEIVHAKSQKTMTISVRWSVKSNSHLTSAERVVLNQYSKNKRYIYGSVTIWSKDGKGAIVRVETDLGKAAKLKLKTVDKDKARVKVTVGIQVKALKKRGELAPVRLRAYKEGAQQPVIVLPLVVAAGVSVTPNQLTFKWKHQMWQNTYVKLAVKCNQTTADCKLTVPDWITVEEGQSSSELKEYTLRLRSKDAPKAKVRDNVVITTKIKGFEKITIPAQVLLR